MGMFYHSIVSNALLNWVCPDIKNFKNKTQTHKQKNIVCYIKIKVFAQGEASQIDIKSYVRKRYFDKRSGFRLCKEPLWMSKKKTNNLKKMGKGMNKKFTENLNDQYNKYEIRYSVIKAVQI